MVEEDVRVFGQKGCADPAVGQLAGEAPGFSVQVAR